MIGWMEHARAQLAAYRAQLGAARAASAVDTVAVTDVNHQASQTECGLYALFYIRRRLEGGGFDLFERQIIPDAAMVAFRQHVFRSAA